MYVGSSQPPSKRVRTAICMCSQCNGVERDYRTVDRHMKEVYLHAVSAHSSEFNNSHDPTCTYPPNTHSVNEDNTDDDNILGMSFTGNAHEQCSVVSNTEEQNHCTLVVSQKKIQEFIIGAVQLKLNHGLSISTTEDYLRNTASLFGNELIPTKWNDVIRFLRSQFRIHHL